MDPTPRIGFLGAGKMATALAKGWLQACLVATEHVAASDPLSQARDAFARETGVAASADNLKVVAASDVLVLAVKPQHMNDLLDEIRPAVTPQHLVISIAAGVTLGQIYQTLGHTRRLVRVMPNTPCLVGASASAYAFVDQVTQVDRDLVEKLFGSVGRVYALPEKLLDAVTGLSGSGPAYVAVMVEALADGGVRMGLPRDIAVALAAQTVLGAAKMLLETHVHPGVLKDMVASPGGTTIAGLHELERGGVRAALMNAVEAATLRSAELGA